jgi:tRNA-2-methylthio-N6-dimethylallyladenosine synthase
MNERDSETLAGLLTEKGYLESNSKHHADVCIINTCSVRENADKRFFGTLGQLKRIKKERPDFVVCVCGCMMQQPHVVKEVKEKYPWVDIVFGTHNIHQFPSLLDDTIAKNEKYVSIWEEGGQIVENLPAKRKHKHKAFVNIMQGCNNFCTYCIVPFTRGRERSRLPEEIKREVEELTADGVREITLLGQNVNSYCSSDTDFTGLIHLLHDIPDLARIRFMTSHPKDLSDDLVRAFGRLEKLCGHIHLPVQSGSNEVLKRMNRKYTREDYLRLIGKLREIRSDMAITTDIIVGFPGETEEDFQDTLGLCEEASFDAAFTFLYSVRKGTPAEKYGDQIHEEMKHERFQRLVDVINSSAAAKNKSREGKIEQVLVEGISKKDPKNLTGRTEGFKKIDFPGPESLVGKVVSVEVLEGKTFSLFGKLCQ